MNLCRPGTRRFGQWAAIVCAMAAGALTAATASPQSTESDAPVGRIRLLPVGERASVVVELSDRVTQVTANEATDDRLVVVEIGPTSAPVIPLTLEAAGTSRLVREVRVREGHGADSRTIRIEVVTLAPATGTLRMGGALLYIDLAPSSSSS